MGRRVDYTIPTKTGRVVKSGFVALLRVGDCPERVKCVVQDDGQLGHYASGYKLGRWRPDGVTMGERRAREAAQLLMDSLVATHGVDRVLRAIESTETING